MAGKMGFVCVKDCLLADDEELSFGSFNFVEQGSDEMAARLAEEFGNGNVVDVLARVDVSKSSLQGLAIGKDGYAEISAAVAQGHYLLSRLAANAAKSAWVMNPT